RRQPEVPLHRDREEEVARAAPVFGAVRTSKVDVVAAGVADPVQPEADRDAVVDGGDESILDDRDGRTRSCSEPAAAIEMAPPEEEMRLELHAVVGMVP